MSMNIQVKRLHEDAVIPVRANGTDAGWDIVAIDDGIIKRDGDCNILYIQYRTGLAIQPDNGFYTELFPRSSVTKTNLFLANSIGLIDEGYRGEIMVRFKIAVSDHDDYFSGYKKGDKIAQLVVKKTIRANFIEVDELSDTERGDGGFGSTGS